MSKTSRSPLFVIFMTVFIDLVGFGIILPLSPFLATHFDASPFEVGLLMSIYSIMQFIFSPLWGRLSDRFGRRPVILISLFGTGLSHLFFAFSNHLWLLFLARGLAGLFGGNLSAAMAYIADVTGHKDRSKEMGLIGAAFGLGFIFGPVIGGGLGFLGAKISVEPPFGMWFPALGAALLCFINFFVAVKVLKESLPIGLRKTNSQREPRLAVLTKYFKRPVIGPLLIVSFLTVFGFAHMEAILFLYVKDVFGWEMTTAAFAFAYVGIVSAFTQGYLVRKALPKYGERKLLVVGLFISALGLVLLGYAPDPYTMAAIITFMSIGLGLRNPSLTGSISLKAGADEQGSVMGVNQSLASLGRIIGPPLGGILYAWYVPSPFILAGAATFLSLAIVCSIYAQIPDDALKKSPTAKPVTPQSSEKTASETEPNFIGEYQFKNLIRQRVNFVFVDLRPAGSIPRFDRSFTSSQDTIIADVKAQSPDPSFPVVVICETGERSLLAARELIKNAFINVVVLQGGTNSLASS